MWPLLRQYLQSSCLGWRRQHHNTGDHARYPRRGALRHRHRPPRYLSSRSCRQPACHGCPYNGVWMGHCCRYALYPFSIILLRADKFLPSSSVAYSGRLRRFPVNQPSFLPRHCSLSHPHGSYHLCGYCWCVTSVYIRTCSTLLTAPQAASSRWNTSRPSSAISSRPSLPRTTALRILS